MLASADLPEVMRVDEIMRMVYTNLRLNEAHRKSSYRDSSGTSTEMTAPELKGWAQFAESKLRDACLLLERETIFRKPQSDHMQATKRMFFESLEEIAESVLALQEALSKQI